MCVQQCLNMHKTAMSGKIFRPWDGSNPHQSATTAEGSIKHELDEAMASTMVVPSTSIQNPSMDTGHCASAIAPFYAPILPTTDYLTGLPSDLLLAQNFAFEEYARVLSQDHQAKLLSGRKQRPKKYKCPHCNVGFSNNGQLKGHIRIHTGERPFKCDEPNCGKTFTRNEELTRHKRIHSGLRPFACPQCGKHFGRKDHLKKHTRTHMQPRNGLFAVPVMLPFDTWAQSTNPFMVPSVPLLY